MINIAQKCDKNWENIGKEKAKRHKYSNGILYF